jgi:DNA repair protein RadC
MENPFTIHDLPRAERPRERLKALGAEALSAQELLTLIIGRGISGKSAVTIAQELLTTFGSIYEISRATIEELSAVRGIGLAKAVQLRAVFELGKRQELEPEIPDYIIKDPESLVKAVRRGIVDKAKEHFKLVLLNARNRVIAISTISVGTLNASLVHPREVFRDALLHSAASIILVHNHPSDDPDPSETDLKITRTLVEAGRLMGIEVPDHIIITRKRHTSLRQKGLL